MLKYFLITSLLFGLFTVPVAAQEPCDPSTIVENLQGNTDLTLLRDALIQALQQVDECTPAEAGTTRSNPVPIGETFVFSNGTIKVSSVETLIPDGFQDEYLQITLEWECFQENENDTCFGSDVTGWAVFVTANGEVIEHVLLSGNYIGSLEVYGGATMIGNIHFAPQEPGGLLRLKLDDEPIFFALDSQ